MTSSSKVANSSGGADDDLNQKLLSPSGLPVRDEIPGGYGVPFFSPLRDRLDYYYFQGAEEYFRSRIARHDGATVLRVNMPPGPFITGSGGSRVVALLDARSYSVLLDDARVDKTDTLDGTFVPPLALFGGHRPMAFLDAADPRHAALKRVAIRLAAARMHHVAPAFHASFGAIFDAVDAADVGSGRGVQFNKLNEHHMFDFTCAALFGGKPPSQAMGDGAVSKAIKWLALQLHPLASKIIRPWPLEDLLLHTFRLPPFLVRRDYAALTAYFSSAASAVLDDAENKSLQQQCGVTRDELLHNLIFLAIFNAYGGFKIFLPHIIKWLARAGPTLHAKLAAEVRAAAPHDREETITVQCVEKSMPLVKSVVWESLRMNPPVEFQYARAREDMVVESHDAAYKVRKGEMLFGYQSLATRDPRVFGARAGEFVADRFVGDEKLLGSVVWSNGPENGVAAEGNKQCPGKDMVVAVGRLLVAELFRRYDTFEAEVKEMPLEPFVTFTSMTKAKAKAAGTSE